MILDFSSVDFGALPLADVLIIGSGPVGLTLAAALESRGLRVVIVEAGADVPDAHLQDDLKTRCVGASLSGLTVGRTRQIGGGLNLWGGQLALIEAADFSRGNRDWRMNWPAESGQLYHCLEETLRFLGAEGVTFQLVHPSIQHERNRAELYSLNIIQTGWLKNPRLDRSFWKWLKKSPSIKLIYNLVCTSLDYDQRSGWVTGTTAMCRSGRAINVKARQTVLAAGSVENARLLLLEAPNCEQAPWHRCKWLGAGFSEHIDATTASIEILDRPRMSDIFDLTVHRGVKYSPKVTWSNRRSVVASNFRLRDSLLAAELEKWPVRAIPLG